MYCFTIRYPRHDSTFFDMAYYKDKHIELVKDRFSLYGLKTVVVKEGVSLNTATNKTLYAATDLIFEDVEGFQSAIAKNGKEVGADIINYTDSKPLFEYSELEYT